MALLNEFHFGYEEAKEVFERIALLAKTGKPIPPMKVLKQDPALSENSKQFITNDGVELCEDETEARSLIDQLEQFRKLRVIYKGTRSVVENLQEANSESIGLALGELERVIVQARSDYEETGIVTSGEGSNAKPVVDRVLSLDIPDRILTGFTKFDRLSGGFARKDLVLVAATTGGGKSVMAEQLAINSYLKFSKNVALVSFEMDDDELYARLVSNLARVPFSEVYLHKFKMGHRQRCYDQWGKFNQHGEDNGCRFSVWAPTVEVTPQQVGATLKPGHFDLILVDYVGLVGTDNQAALWENLGSITKQFKLMANEQDCVVIVFAQLDEDTNKVKYSKAMRHHSSWVWKWAYGDEEKQMNQITIHQDKCRHSEQFDFDLMAKFQFMAFEDAGDATHVTDADTSAKEDNEKARDEKEQYKKKLEGEPVTIGKPKTRIERSLASVDVHDFDPEDE